MLALLQTYGLYGGLALALVALVALLWYSVGARKALLDLAGMAHVALGHWLASRPLDEAQATALISALFDEGTLYVPLWLRLVFPKALIVPALVHLVLTLEASQPPPVPGPPPAP